MFSYHNIHNRNLKMRCIVPGCTIDSRCTLTSKSVTFHIFPKDVTLSETWLNSLQIKDRQLTENSAVCSKHFQEDDYIMSVFGERCLQPGAIPVIKLDKSEEYKWKTMCSIKVCRICFANDCTLYSMIDHKKIYEAYEALTGLSVENDNLPKYLCAECKCRLLNCFQFRTKSMQANLILQDIIRYNDHLTLEAIKSCSGYQSFRSTLGVTHKQHYDLELEYIEKENITIKIEKKEAKDEDIEDKEMTKMFNSPRLHEVTVPGIKLERMDGYSQDDFGGSSNCNDECTVDTMGIRIKVEPLDIPNQDEADNDGYLPHSGGHLGEDYSSDNMFFGEVQKLKHKVQNRLQIRSGTKPLIKIKPGKKYLCDVCNKVFNKKYNLITHLRVHTRVKPFSCDLCEQKFSLKHDLVNHMRKHSGEKPYACDICKRTFILRNVLQAHIRTHTGEKPFVCKICGKAFSQRANVTAHIKIHSGEKPYSCDICMKGFSQRCNLITHSRTHSGEKPYSCNLCNISFSRNYHLQSHLKKHSGEKPYICNFCKKAFTSQSNLQKHMTVHSGDKPYSCQVCNKTFNRKGNLNTHIKTHSSERPHPCEICNKAFRRKDQLKIHARIHGLEKPLGFVNVQDVVPQCSQ